MLCIHLELFQIQDFGLRQYNQKHKHDKDSVERGGLQGKNNKYCK